ncbi:MAG TPA: phosphotransferase [Nocardioidaceae bacterium]|nr:phosphotransferase [Nocardioidaceae bacterium]
MREIEETGVRSGVEHWASPQFRAEAAGWVRDVCHPLGIELTGESEQPHCRPWSSAIRFGSTAGPVWFKVNGPGTRHEGPLLAVLSGVVPGLVAELLARDDVRGWSLTRDAGPVLRTVAEPGQLWSHWEGVLRRYAAAQLVLSAHVPDLLATGVARVTPTTLPGQAAGLVEKLATLEPEKGGLSGQEACALQDRLPELDAWCAELAASPLPLSVQHDDLHSSNICWGGSVETARIIDWGDASVGHPFGTMLCTLNSIGWHVGLAPDDARLTRTRDAYLEPFTSYADRSDLVRHVALARRVGCVTRALSHQAAFLGASLAAEAKEDFPVRGWLLELLEN